jgi:hypothetical protein
MRFIAGFAILAVLITSALCRDAQVSSAISELGALITEIPAIITAGGSGLAHQLASLLKILDPNGVVSDLPMIFSSDLPAIESYLAAFLTAAIPAGAVPTDIVANIPAFVAGEGSLILSDLDALVTRIPGSLSLSDKALPSFLAAILPQLGTDIEGIASAVVDELSKSLGSTSTAPANATALTTTSSITSATSTSFSLTGGSTASGTVVTATHTAATTPNAAATATGAAATIRWKTEIAAVLGFAAVVALFVSNNER